MPMGGKEPRNELKIDDIKMGFFANKKYGFKTKIVIPEFTFGGTGLIISHHPTEKPHILLDREPAPPWR